MTSNVAIVRASYEAFHHKDLAGVLAAFTIDAAWTHPTSMTEFGLGGTKKGHEEIATFIKKVPQFISKMQINPIEFIESGNKIIVFGTRLIVPISGGGAIMKFVHSWSFVNGKANEFEDYFDTAEMIELIKG